MYNLNDVLKSDKLFKHVAKQTFDSVDSDGSGKISEDELHIILCSIAKDIDYDIPTLDETSSILKAIDKDKSGLLDYEEFLILFGKLLEIIKDA